MLVRRRARGLFLCASVVAVSSLSCASSVEHAAGEDSSGDALAAGETYQLVAEHSGKALEVDGSSRSDGARALQRAWRRGANQQWQLRRAADGGWELWNLHSRKCLDVEGISKAAGAPLQQWECWGGANQAWRLRARGGAFEVVSVNSGQCLDVRAVSESDGAPVIQWPCHGGPNQRWRLARVAPDGGGLEGCPRVTDERSVAVYAPAPGRTGAWWCQNHFGNNVGGTWACLGVEGARCESDAPRGATVRCGLCATAPPPPAPEPGARPSARFVGILYSTWADHMMNGNPPVRLMSRGAPYGPHGSFNWWGEPAYGIERYRFMVGKNPDEPNRELIDYHADLLHAAGIDFIGVDLSNGEQDLIVKATMAVAKRYSERPRERTPGIVLFVRDERSVPFMREVFYSGRYAPRVFFEYDGKPLILVAHTDRAIPTGGALDAFTARRMWGLQETSDKWSFKLNTEPSRPGTAFWHDGKPEEMSVCPATQATYMTTPAGRKGRDGGRYFAEQWDYVFRTKPRVVFVTGWNEWGAQNLGDERNPVFVDQFQTEWSSDIEPMRGGHGARYYELMKGYVQRFKSL